jgi:pimeloyl-ACP methyl ester carboxylesterase
MIRIFLHGLESSSRGAKATFLRDQFPEMLIPDFKGSLSERMKSLNTVLAGRRGIVLAGSSFGGLMATLYAMEKADTVERLVLLAPALNFPDFSGYGVKQVSIPTRMIIGRHDTVTPAEMVVPVARRIFTDLTYEEVNDDHMLAGTFRSFDWKSLLQE